jgi:hypothetical protein
MPRLLSDEIDAVTRRISIIAMNRAEQRLLEMVRSFLEPVQTLPSNKMAIPLKPCEIASRLGVIPETLESHRHSSLAKESSSN